MLVAEAVHLLEQLVLAAHDVQRVQTGDLAHAQHLLGDVELLEIRGDHLLHGLIGADGGEKFLAQIVQIDIGDAGQTLGHGNIPLGAGGGLEHYRVGQDGRGHEAGHGAGGNDAVLLIHGGDDGVGAAHRLIAHINGLAGLDICQTVVVDDLQYLRLIQARHGLGDLVMIHQHHLLAAGAQQVVAGQGAHDVFVFVQHGVAAVAALEHHLADVVYVVVQMEAHDLAPLAGTGDGDGLIDQAAHAACGEGRGDDAGVALVIFQIRVDLRAADDEAAHLLIQRTLDHVRLAGAEDDVVAAGKAQVLGGLGHGHHHVAADAGGDVAALVDDAPLQHADQIEHRQLLHMGVHQRLHAEGGDVAGGEHAVERAVVVHHGNGGNALLVHHMPRPIHGDGGA